MTYSLTPKSNRASLDNQSIRPAKSVAVRCQPNSWTGLGVTSWQPLITPLLATTSTAQAKLKIGSPHDKYEQEADRVAAQVMRMPKSQVTTQLDALEVKGNTQTKETVNQRAPASEAKRLLSIPVLDSIQRVCGACKEEETLQQIPIGNDKDVLQPKRDRNHIPLATPSIQNGISRLRQSGGATLPTSTRSFMESRFGHEFSNVKIHTNPQAVNLSQSVNARAFTVGHDIFFNQGEFQPGSDAGMRLLAHELTHTLQQTSQINRRSSSEEVIQRLVSCESSEDCPSRRSGEIERSRSEPMELSEITSGGVGILLHNFAIGSSDIKGSLSTNPGWNRFVRGMADNPNITWEILGFTDCQGNEARNTSLRTTRATSLYLALPDNAMAQVEGYGSAALNECIRNNASEDNRRINRSAIIRQTSVSYEFDPLPVEGEVRRTVYMCSKPLDTSPLGSHAFFRFDSPAPGNDTLSLQPALVNAIGDCWQGIPDWNYPSDKSAPGSCDMTTIRFMDLVREFKAYPIGHYCTWGPNSNTFVGHLARRTGIPSPDPPGVTPGIDDSPPPSGTYAPNKWVTLAGCETKQCTPDAIGPDVDVVV